MGHQKSYLHLQKRLEKFPQSAPISETLFQILEVLFTPEEAELVSKLPIKFFEIKIVSFRSTEQCNCEKSL